MDLKDAQSYLDALAPAGYYIALRVGYSFPEEEINRLSDRWVDLYTKRGLVVQDPIMRWVYAHNGVMRWRDLTLPDPAQVLKLARQSGLHYGATASFTRPEDHGKRSYVTVFRVDRDFTDRELSTLNELLRELHCNMQAHKNLSPAEVEAIRYRAEGMLLKQIAGKLEISESAVKARLMSARKKLGAKNMLDTLAIATARRLI